MIFFWSVLVKDIMDLLYWVWHTCPHYQIPSHHFRRGNTKRLLTVSLSALNTFISTAVRTHLLDTLRVPLRMNFFSIRNSLHFLLSYLRFSCICSHDGEGHHPTSREVIFPTLHVCEKTSCLASKSAPSAFLLWALGSRTRLLLIGLFKKFIKEKKKHQQSHHSVVPTELFWCILQDFFLCIILLNYLSSNHVHTFLVCFSFDYSLIIF